MEFRRFDSREWLTSLYKPTTNRLRFSDSSSWLRSSALRVDFYITPSYDTLCRVAIDPSKMGLFGDLIDPFQVLSYPSSDAITVTFKDLERLRELVGFL